MKRFWRWFKTKLPQYMKKCYDHFRPHSIYSDALVPLLLLEITCSFILLLLSARIWLNVTLLRCPSWQPTCFPDLIAAPFSKPPLYMTSSGYIFNDYLICKSVIFLKVVYTSYTLMPFPFPTSSRDSGV